MHIVSYGTEDGIYDHHLQRLKESCERFDLKSDFQVFPPFKSREEALRRKPSFLIEMLQKHDSPIVWIDADAVVARSFALPAGHWDIGLVPNTIRDRRHVNPVASFVVAVQPSNETLDFLRTWDYLCRWPVSPKGDHHRLIAARHLQRKMYTEIDLTTALRYAIIRDVGGHKENTIQSDLDFYLSRIRRRLTGERKRHRQKLSREASS